MTEAPMKTLAGKIALVTGASSGIGRAAAFELARRGAKVVAGARRKTEIEAMVAELRSEGLEATSVVADINVEQNVIDLVSTTISTYGRIDAAFNNAGTEGAFSPFVDQANEVYDLIPLLIDQNSWAHFRRPMDMMRQGWARSLFQASQQ